MRVEIEQAFDMDATDSSVSVRSDRPGVRRNAWKPTDGLCISRDDHFHPSASIPKKRRGAAGAVRRARWFSLADQQAVSISAIAPRPDTAVAGHRADGHAAM